MSYFSAVWACEACNVEWEDLVPRAKRDSQVCPQCGGPSERQVGAPLVLKASFLDGTRRFDRLRAQDVLDRAASEAQTGDDRKRIAVERTKLADSSKT